MRTIDNYNFAGKRALMRVDFNVPLDENFKITDDTRIRAAIPSIQKILNDGGSVVLMSHLGRPKSGPEEKYSLIHLVERLSQEFNTTVLFAKDCIGPEAARLAQDLQPGQILLLENLRFHKAEEKGDPDFAKELAALGDVYVNDAFGTAHRAHASTAIIARYFPKDKVMGYVMFAELDNARRVLENAERPFTAIMGGAKISDKILIIEKLLDRVDNLLIGGGMSYTFVKADGGQIGASLVEEDKVDLASRLIGMAREKGVNLMIPVDSVVADAFSNDANVDTSLSHHIKPMWMGLDIGPTARDQYAEVILNSKTILWNGPMGVFEMSNFSVGTEGVAEAVVEATRRGAYSLIGGGDSAAAVNQLGYADKVSYVSTGGGALLEYMEGRELPGVVAIERDDY
ncbi:phosphoglycerate kinase [Pontibacter ummariensis]|uniref:Phosphoglycerate kinase n=1 Tax=Pontibacter ummariensis TaxID=1610492 RepID=A0A239EQI2_9BACT|nr:phosphoglycerate kinase [Pontibacter ummariensis]PRY12798.1 phosphoglycerate kinase [Pontibacter ummariensis]SNS46895.1 phosphoglycerate kinase [Pontibacter ummariensis]